jgi:hypothetical protein
MRDYASHKALTWKPKYEFRNTLENICPRKSPVPWRTSKLARECHVVGAPARALGIRGPRRDFWFVPFCVLQSTVGLIISFTVFSCPSRPDFTFLGPRYCHPTPTMRLTSAPECRDLMHGERGFNGGGRVRGPIYGVYFFSLALLGKDSMCPVVKTVPAGAQIGCPPAEKMAPRAESPSLRKTP